MYCTYHDIDFDLLKQKKKSEKLENIVFEHHTYAPNKIWNSHIYLTEPGLFWHSIQETYGKPGRSFSKSIRIKT